MPYRPTPAEARRLERAIDAAAPREGERIFWLIAFLSVVAVGADMLIRGATWVGLLGFLPAVFALYWRLRGVHLAGRAAGDRGLFGLGLRTREQRAFTALMFRTMLAGRNPLAPRPEHDPLAGWRGRRPGAAAAQESA